MVAPNLIHLPSFTVSSLPHFGDYTDMQKNFGALQNYLIQTDCLNQVDSFFGIYQQGACTTDIHFCRFDACVKWKQKEPTHLTTLQVTTITAGVYLHYQHKHDHISQSYRVLYLAWLPKQTYQINTKLPAFEHYQSNPATTTPSKLITDIYIPILHAEQSDE